MILIRKKSPHPNIRNDWRFGREEEKNSAMTFPTVYLTVIRLSVNELNERRSWCETGIKQEVMLSLILRIKIAAISRPVRKFLIWEQSWGHRPWDGKLFRTVVYHTFSIISEIFAIMTYDFPYSLKKFCIVMKERRLTEDNYRWNS